MTTFDWYSVKDYGATGNGTTDDTAAIQSTITAAGSGGTVFFPPGTYLVSSTLTGLSNQQFIGSGANSTIIYRTGDYGDTLAIGSPSQGALAVRVSGIWFMHSVAYADNSGQTTIANLATSGAHLHLIKAQGALIDNCWFQRLPYNVILDGCTITHLKDNAFAGVWDPNYTALQEGIACLWLATTNGNNEIILVDGNYFSGYISSSRTITYTTADKDNQNVTAQQFVGSQYGILNYGCEDFCFTNNYVGDFSAIGLYHAFASDSVNLDYRIANNFFDGAGAYQGANFYFGNQSGSNALVNGVTITGNVFNGEINGEWHIVAFSTGSSSVFNNFSITGNTFQASVGTPIYLLAASGGVINGNSITGYNAQNISNTDETYVASIFLTSAAAYITVTNNRIGGAINADSPTCYCYLGVVASGLGTAGTVTVRNNDAVGIGSSGAIWGKSDKNVVLISQSSNYQMTGWEDVLVFSNTGSSAMTIGLPEVNNVGATLTVKDGNGTAGTYNLVLNGFGHGNIDGASTLTISTNYGKATLTWNGSQWNQIG